MAELSGLIAMIADVKAKQTIAKQVEQRVREGLCLLCDSEAKRRGLCFAHYQMYRRRLFERPRKDRASFEVNAIREGKILAAHQMRELKTADPFAEC